MYSTIRTLLLTLGLVAPVLASAQTYQGTMTRASFVQFVMSSKGIPAGGSNCFADVRTESFAAAVCGARNAGIVSGNPNGQFRPFDAVTFAEAAAMVVRAERVSVPADSIWYRPYIEKLSEWNAIPSSINNILQPLNTTQASEIVTKAIHRNGGSSSSRSSAGSTGSQTDGDLSVSVDDSTVEPGDRVTFTIRINNDRNRDIETDLNAFLDDDMEFVSASDGGEEVDEDEEIEWQDIEVEEDDSETITLKVRIDSRADDGDSLRVRFETDDDEVSIRLNVEDDDNDDDDDDDDEDADISVSISETDDPVEAGDTVTYRIRLTNNSNDDEETDVTALLDDDMTFVSADEGGFLSGGDEVEWNDIEVREDRTVTLLLTVRIDNSADDGDTLELEVETDDDEDTEETEVDDDDDDNDGDEDIDISINASDSSVRVGDTVTFQIRLENNDNDDIQPVIRAHLDDAMSYLSSGNGGELIGNDEVKWDDVEIEEDDDRTIQLTVRINDRVRAGDTLVLRVEAGDDERSVSIRGEN